MKKMKLIILGSLIGFILVISGVSYAYLRKASVQDNNNVVSTLDCLNVTLTDTENGNTGINITNQVAMSDAEGLKNSPYKFTLTNNCPYPVKVDINLETLSGTTLNKNYLKYNLNKMSSSILGESPEVEAVTANATSNKMGSTILAASTDVGHSANYELRLWIDENTSWENGGNKTYNGKVVIYASPTKTKPASEYFNIATLSGSGNMHSVPGRQVSYQGSVGTMNIDPTTYGAYTWTYAEDYEVVNNKFNLKNVKTLIYNDDMHKLVGKYLISYSIGNNTDANGNQKTGTTNLSAIYYVREVFNTELTYETYQIMTFNETQANSEWTYGTDVTQATNNNGRYYNLNGVTKKVLSTNKEDFVGKFLTNTNVSTNIAASPTTINLSTIYEIKEVGSTYLVYTNSPEAGISETTDDYGTSLYYRGAVTNNYVIYANMCWRIVRIDGASNIKLALYNYNPNGLANPCTEVKNSVAFARYNNTTTGQAGQSEFNATNYTVLISNSNRSFYQYNAGIGYMMGVPGSSTYAEEHANTYKSTILTNLMTWYDKYISSSNYDTRLADTIWCNDKRIGTTSSSTTNAGTNRVTTYYAAYDRLYTPASSMPTLECGSMENTNIISKYTASDSTNGNAALTINNKEYKVGLLTADEVAFAGSAYNLGNTSYYLYKNANSLKYWTSSPSHFNGYAYTLDVNNNGSLYYGDDVRHSESLRPSVSLSSAATLTTNYSENPGTSANPYIVI